MRNDICIVAIAGALLSTATWAAGTVAAGENPAEFERNKLARCDKHTGEDRDLCIRRMNGEGTISGSVESGGIYRELRVQVPAEQQ